MSNPANQPPSSTPPPDNGNRCCNGGGAWRRVLLFAVIAAGFLLFFRLTGGKCPCSCGGGQSTCPTVMPPAATPPAAVPPAAAIPAATPATTLPRLVDLGATKCIPCKMMAPILAELKTTYAGKLDVEFIDVWQNPDAGKKYGINIIPTQIFFDAAGKERFRHEGFFGKDEILAKWKEFGVELTTGTADKPVSRWTPAQPDQRARETVCQLCDGDITPANLVLINTDQGTVRLCGMHHYFVMYSCLTENRDGFAAKVSVTDWGTGKQTPITSAAYVCGTDAKTGRPTIKAFASRDAAEKEQLANGGSVLDLAGLQAKELANTCGFCDRAVYPEDAAAVIVGDHKTWGCCSHCALGVAARTGKDIEVRERDRLTGEPVIVKTSAGMIASLEPATAVAWFGQRTKADGTHATAGCFHQGFFATAENLRKWLEANPLETGEQITIAKALADKMKLTPQQISKACKIGTCAPK